MSNWPIKKLRWYVLAIIVGVAVIVSVFELSDFSDQFNVLVLIFTLAVLLWYAYDTHRIANQTIKNNLRPVILRSGWISRWEDMEPLAQGQLAEPKHIIHFSILKNIAKDIRGHIVLNGNKYRLLFGNEISKQNVSHTELISNLEFKVLALLYEEYQRTNQMPRRGTRDIYDTLGINEGDYVGILTDSEFVQLDGEEYLLTDEGIRFMEAKQPQILQFESKWGWMNSGTSIRAVFRRDSRQNTTEESNIYITYKDMEGNKYFTKEDINFSQSSGKL